MSDVPSGARAPDATTGVDVPAYPAQTYPAETYPAQTYATETYTTDTYATGDSGEQSKAKQVAGQTKEAATQAAGDVKDTAKEQAQRVGSEAKAQARNIASDVKSRVSDQARTQNDKLVGGIRQMADHLEEMRGDRADSPAAAVVSRVAQSGRQVADYLDRNGPEGLLREVQDFARRRPGAFLASALAAGFVVARLGKSVAKADSTAGADKPGSDSFVSNTPATGYSGTPSAGYSTTPGYTTGTGYVDPAVTDAGYASTEYASTGTGTPVVVEEEYPPTGGYSGGVR